MLSLKMFFSMIIFILTVLTGVVFLNDTHATSPEYDSNTGSGLNVPVMQHLLTFISKNDTQASFKELGYVGENITICYENNMCPDQKIRCFCDNLCVHYGDCCSNARSLFIYLNRTSVPKHTNESLSQSEVLARHSTCLPFQNVTTNYMRVVNTCPEGSSEENARKCLYGNDRVFVSYISKENSQIVLRNKYCADCHGLSSDKILFWNYSVLCDGSKVSDNILGFNSFQLHRCTKYAWAPHPLETLRFCFDAGLEGCGRNTVRNKANAAYYDLCRLYLNPVTVKHRYEYTKFRNSYCRLCFQIDKPKMNNSDECSNLAELSHGPVGAGGGSANPTTISSLINLNVLLSFDVKSNLWKKQSDKRPICPGTEIYDYDKGKCASFCGKGQKNEGDTCVKVSNGNVGVAPPILNSNFPGKFHSSLQHVTSSFVVSTTVPITNIFEQPPINDVILCAVQNLTNADFDTNVIGNICLKISSLRYSNRSLFTILESSINGDFESCRFKLNRIDYTVLPYIIHDLKLHFRKFGKLNANIFLNNFANLSDIVCSSDQTRTIAHNVSLFTANDTYRIDLSEINNTIALTDTKFNMTFSGDMETPLIETVVYCTYDTQNIHRMLNCTNMTYKLDAFIYTEQNNTVFLAREQKHLTEWDHFAFIKNNLVVCVNQSDEEYPSYEEIIGWVSVGTMSVSCLSLLGLISLHVAIKDLRNLHGKCILSFSISLLIAQFGFLLNTILLHKFDLVCKVSAIVYHYAWLCTFAWNGVMAYDVARRFSVFSSLTLKLDDGSDSYRFLRYSLFSWIIPLLFIGAVNAIDQIFNGQFLEYGRGQVCWINSFIGKITTICIPMLTMLLFAIICFSISMHGIEYNSRVGILRSKTRRNRNRCMIYTKISIFLGLTWVFGYLEVFTNMKIFEYISVIVNGLHGFILLIGVLINSKLTICSSVSKYDTSSAKS